MHEGRVIVDFVVANGTVAFAHQVAEAGVLVVEREKNPVGGVQSEKENE